MTIILIGYMGSGKSTIGENLSKAMKMAYVDLDIFIQKKEHTTIPELFKSKGEIYFRKIEAQHLKELLAMEHSIISLGGGTPCYGHNMQLINEAPAVKSIYLKASIPSLVGRLYAEKATRPLIAHLDTRDELTEFIGKHLFERSYYYNQADVTVSVDGKTVNEITSELVSQLS